MIKKEEERLRASMRRESKQKRIRERMAVGGGGGRSVTGAYLEPDRGGYEDSDDEGAISLAAIKNKYKKGQTPRGQHHHLLSISFRR